MTKIYSGSQTYGQSTRYNIVQYSILFIHICLLGPYQIIFQYLSIAFRLITTKMNTIFEIKITLTCFVRVTGNLIIRSRVALIKFKLTFSRGKQQVYTYYRFNLIKILQSLFTLCGCVINLFCGGRNGPRMKREKSFRGSYVIVNPGFRSLLEAGLKNILFKCVMILLTSF